MNYKMKLLAVVVSSLFVAPTMAQTAPASATAAAVPADAGLEEIIVTAQKRSEKLQNVAVSVTALNAEMIENQGIKQFSDLAQAIPSLTVLQATTNANSSIFLRGIGTSAFSIAVEPSVSVVVDDIAVVQQAQAFSGLNDIERIEVLRGPQGTLFGKNASAGVVNIVTKSPTDNFSGLVQVTLTDDKETKAEVMLSGPLSADGKTGFRLNAFKTTRKGYIKNLATGADFNNADDSGIRGKLDFSPSNQLRVVLAADYSKNNTRGSVNTLLDVPAGSAYRGIATLPLAAALSGVTPGPANYNVRFNDEPFQNTTQSSASAKVTYDLGSSQLISVTSNQDWKYRFFEDQDGTTLDIVGALVGGGRTGGLVQGGPFHAKQFSEELRLVSTGSGPLKYLAGLFYADSKTDRSFNRSTTTGLLTGALAGLNALWQSEAGSKSSSVFGQVDYNIDAKTRVTGGVRANNEKISVVFNDSIPAIPASFRGTSSDNAMTYKLALQHDVAEQVMLFATAATGYKGQAYDVSSGFNQSRADQPVKPEKSRAYEGGIKSRFLENKLQLNATLFRSDYDQFQAQSAVLTATGLVAKLNNVGKLRTQGLEVDLSAKPMNALRLDASFAYVDAKIVSFPNATCFTGQTAAQGCVNVAPAGFAASNAQDLSGQALSNSPKTKYNIGATYNFVLTGTGIDGFASLNYQHQSAVNFDLFRNPLTVQQDYGLVNGSIGLADSKDDRWKVTLFVNNLANKHYAAQITDGGGTFGGLHVLTQQLARNSQRYGGIRLRYQF